MKEKIYAIIAESLAVDLDKITGDLGPGDLPEWDSFAQQGLILALESKLNISFDIDEVLEMEAVDDIVEIIQNKMS